MSWLLVHIRNLDYTKECGSYVALPMVSVVEAVDGVYGRIRQTTMWNMRYGEEVRLAECIPATQGVYYIRNLLEDPWVSNATYSTDRIPIVLGCGGVLEEMLETLEGANPSPDRPSDDDQLPITE